MPFENGSEFVSEMPLGIEKFIHIFTCYDYTIFNIALNFSLDNFFASFDQHPQKMDHF